MANKFHKYDDLLDESRSYRAAAEKALIRSFYDKEQDLPDYLYSKFVPSSLKKTTRNRSLDMGLTKHRVLHARRR